MPEVILWADTFNNYFHPETSRAALEVLQSAGFHVTVPQGHLCCGRPLYDFGMLDKAKQYLERILSVLSASKSMRAFRSSSWNRAALPYFATNCAICFHWMRAPRNCGARHFFSANFSSTMLPAISRRNFPGKCCCMGTAITNR